MDAKLLLHTSLQVNFKNTNFNFYLKYFRTTGDHRREGRKEKEAFVFISPMI
jgi:hypothetical protein